MRISHGSVLIVALALAPLTARAQWMQTNGPYGAWVFCIDTLGSNIFIGTTNGIFKSTDQGSSWESANNGLPQNALCAFCENISSIACHGSNIYTTIVRDGIYRSTDSGSSWVVLPNSLNVQTLGSSRHAIFALHGNYLSASTNDGNKWTPADSDLMNLAQPDAILTVDTTTYVAGAWILQTANGLKWDVIAIPPSGDTWHITSLANIGDVLFALNHNFDILRSTNRGESWDHVDNGLPPELPNSLISLASLGNDVFVGSTNGFIYRSTDSGLHWQRVSTGLPIGAEIDALKSNGAQLLAGYNGPGLFHSYDTGTTWLDCNQGILNISTNSIVTAGDTIYVGTNGGVFRTIDNLQEWQPVQKGLTSYRVKSLLSDGGNLYAGTAAERRPFSFSTDGGESWVSLGWATDSESSPYSIDVIVRSGTTLIVGGEPRDRGNGFFVSTDQGVNWSECPVISGYTNIIPSGILKVGTTWLSATNGGPYISHDGGSTWYESNRGFTYTQNLFTNALTLNGSKVFVSRIGPTTLDKGVIFISDDTGSTWHPVVDTSIPPKGYGTSFASYGTALFLSTDSNGIFLTTDDGAHWIDEDQGLADSSVLSLAIQGDELLAGTANSGVWRRPLKEMIPPSSVASIPDSAARMAAYPNPSNGMVAVDCPGISGQTEVSLTSEAGITIWRKTLVSDGGRIALDLSAIPNGAYRLLLRSKTKQYTTPLLLLR